MYKNHHVAREIAANIAMGVPTVRQLRVRRGRTVGVPPTAKARAIVDQFDFFMDSIGWQNLPGKTVVEIGPGDAIPLAPLFLGAGARRYVALDRFLGDVHGDQAIALCRAAIACAPPNVVSGLAALGIDAADDGSVADLLRNDARVALVRAGIESGVDALREAQGADFIVSFNVCEHLADLAAALATMAKLISPTGRIIHRIDYGPHDVWLRYANPLVFLTIPTFLWRLMASNRGCPNRMRHHELVSLAHSLGLKSLDRPGTCASSAAIREIRPHLAAEFRGLSDGELAVLDAEVVFGFDGPLTLGRPFTASGEFRPAS